MKIIIFFFFFFLLAVSFCLASSVQSRDPLGPEGLSLKKLQRTGVNTSAEETLVLAGRRTDRPDILRHLRKYRGGWNPTNKHYWTSVGFTGAAPAILLLVWLLSFTAALIMHHCRGWRIHVQEGSNLPRTCIILMIAFTSVTAIGSILVFVGQDEFHGEAMDTRRYLLNQSEYIQSSLTDAKDSLLLAKTVTVAQFLLPSDDRDMIEELTKTLNTTAHSIHRNTGVFSRKMQRYYNPVRLSLIIIAAVMLIGSILGLVGSFILSVCLVFITVLSYFGYRRIVHICIIIGWIAVTVTFFAWGGSVVINNLISDTCMAMGDWVDNPQAKTAIGTKYTCLDQGTTNKTLVENQRVANDIVALGNQFIYLIADQDDLSPKDGFPYYYNQSGPLLPSLCYPYDDRLQDRDCASSEVPLENASKVLKNFTCSVSESGVCASPGRLLPEMYNELVAAANLSRAIHLNTPTLLRLQNCNILRDVFGAITSGRCRPLENHLRLVTAGLVMICVGSVLCVSLWLVYVSLQEESSDQEE